MGEDGLRQLGGFLRMEVRSHQVANEAELIEVRVDTVVVVVVGGSRLAKVHNFRSSR